MKIHQEGKNILTILLLILIAINLPVYMFLQPIWIAYTIITLSIIFYLLILNFFRSPKRHFKGDTKNVVVAPADGTVVALEEVLEDEYFHDKRIQVSIFMTVFNVHANWFPVNGTVTHVHHQDGRFMAAYLPKSSTDNERSTVVIKTPGGEEILMRQIAGALARRIVTYAEPGEECHIDQHVGFIKFGSRVDLFLPIDSEILVSLKEKTVGNMTVIARLK